MPELALLRHAIQKPPVGPVKIDVGHPLAAGLVGLVTFHEFGSMVMNEIVNGLAIARYSANPGSWGSAYGVSGFQASVANAGASVNAPKSLQLQPPITLVWKGAHLATPDQWTLYFGVTYTNAGTSPFSCYLFNWHDLASAPQLEFNSAGTYQSLFGGTRTVGAMWLAATISGTTQKLYHNDPVTAVATSSVSLASIGYGTTPLLCVGETPYDAGRNSQTISEVAHIYNRILTNAELAWLRAEPYCMVQTRPAQRFWRVGGIVSAPRSFERHGVQKPPPGILKLDPSHPLSAGLVGLYLLNERGSPLINNYAIPGSASRGSLTGAPSALWSWEAGAGDPRVGSVLNFAGGSQNGPAVDLGTDAGWPRNLNAPGVTVAVLAFLTANTVTNYLKAAFARGFWTGDTQAAFNLSMYALSGSTGAASWRFGCHPNGIGEVAVAEASASPAGVWSFVVGTYDGDQMRLYRDGVLMASSSTAFNRQQTFDNSQNTILGSYPNQPVADSAFNGKIAYAAVWQRGMQTAEVRQLTAEPYSMLQARPAIRWAGAGVGGAAPQTYTKSLAGTVTPSGAITRQTGKALASTTTPSGAITRQTGKVLAGAVTPSGTVQKLVAKGLAGTVTPTGALTITRVLLRSFSGTVTPAGALIKQVGKILGGTETPSGTVVRQTAKKMVGTVTPAGALAASRAILRSFAGTVTPTGVIGRQVGKALGSTTTPAGTIVRAIAKGLAGAVTPSGAIVKQTTRSVGGSVTPSGVVGRLQNKATGGTVAPSGTVSRLPSKSLGGTIAAVGAVRRQVTKAFAGVVTAAGVLATSLIPNLGTRYPGLHTASDQPTVTREVYDELG